MAKVAVITAAGKGIGAACAEKLHQQGYQLALMSNSGGAEALAGKLGGVSFTGSINNQAHLAQFVDMALQTYGQIDVVVNNTGHTAKGNLLSIADQDWHNGLDMLLLNVVRMAKLVVPAMQTKGKGAFVNISTYAAAQPSLSFPVSSVIRAGLSAYVKLFADQFAQHNIRMNNVLPGFVNSYPVKEEFLQQIPMLRYGNTEEVANTVAFLASDEATYITGQNITVDGGLTKAL